jgi:hypothetical protein
MTNKSSCGMHSKERRTKRGDSFQTQPHDLSLFAEKPFGIDLPQEKKSAASTKSNGCLCSGRASNANSWTQIRRENTSALSRAAAVVKARFLRSRSQEVLRFSGPKRRLILRIGPRLLKFEQQPCETKEHHSRSDVLERYRNTPVAAIHRPAVTSIRVLRLVTCALSLGLERFSLRECDRRSATDLEDWSRTLRTRLAYPALTSAHLKVMNVYCRPDDHARVNEAIEALGLPE